MGYVSSRLYGEDSIDVSLLDGTRIFDVNLSHVARALKKIEAQPVEVFPVETSTPDFYLEPREEGGFVAFSKEYPGAVGQGETREEALKDLEEAIQLLKEVLEEDKALEKER